MCSAMASRADDSISRIEKFDGQNFQTFKMQMVLKDKEKEMECLRNDLLVCEILMTKQVMDRRRPWQDLTPFGQSGSALMKS